MVRFLFIVMSLVSAPAFAYNHRPTVERLRGHLAAMDSQKMAGDTDRAIEGLLRLAEREAGKNGDDLSDLRSEWDGHFKGYLGRMLESREGGVFTGIGDHAPLAQWLTDLYDRLDAALGPELMAFLHLDDIRTINYCIPVVFHLDTIHDGEIDEPEYAVHFVPFCGVVAYWGVWFGCEIATYGGGWFLVCSPAAMLAEYATTEWVAPKFAEPAYKHFY
jgi:hypothetical protein